MCVVHEQAVCHLLQGSQANDSEDRLRPIVKGGRNQEESTH